METWIIYAIISAIFGWFYNFTFKILVERKYDTSYVTFISFVFSALFSWIWLTYYLINNSIILNELLITLLLSFINVLFFSISIFTRVESMRNIDTVIFYPIYKTFWPIIVTLLSLYFFNEVLNIKEIFWIIIGITIPLLLITSNEKTIQKNLKRWVIFILITAIFTAISSWATKELMVQNFSIELFIFTNCLMWWIINYIIYKKNKYKKDLKHKWIIKFWMITWFFHLTSFILFTKALAWNFAIVFTINSFSILIPIILSVIIYKEHFSIKKAFIIALSIVSILLFI